jgi:hypothetical protein
MNVRVSHADLILDGCRYKVSPVEWKVDWILVVNLDARSVNQGSSWNGGSHGDRCGNLR